MAARKNKEQQDQPDLPPPVTAPASQDGRPPSEPSSGPSAPTQGQTPSTDLIDPRLVRDVYGTEIVGATYEYALGVRGRRVFNQSGDIIKYEGYRYFNTRPSPWGPGTVTSVRSPKYFSGDEDLLTNQPVETVVNIQRAMNQVGLLGKGYTVGVVDSATKNAYRNLLEQANEYGEDWEQSIIRLASAGSGRSGSLAQYRVSNPDDVKAVVNQTAERLLGRKLPQGDLDRISRLYLEEERRVGRSQRTETMSAPNVGVFAEQQIEQSMGEETTARQFGGYMEAIKEKYGL